MRYCIALKAFPRELEFFDSERKLAVRLWGCDLSKYHVFVMFELKGLSPDIRQMTTELKCAYEAGVPA